MFFAKDLVCSWRHVWADQSWSVIITVIHSMTGLVLNLQWQGKYVVQVNKYCSCPVFMHAIQPKMTKTCKKYTMRFAGLKDEGFKNAVCVIAKFWCNMVMNLRHFARYICICNCPLLLVNLFVLFVPFLLVTFYIRSNSISKEKNSEFKAFFAPLRLISSAQWHRFSVTPRWAAG